MSTSPPDPAARSIAAALNLSPIIDGDVIRSVDAEGDAVRVVYKPPQSTFWEVTTHLIGVAAGAYDPLYGLDTPAAVVGELRGEADGTERSYEWRAEAAWLKRYLTGEWDEERLLDEIFEDAEGFDVIDGDGS